MLPRAALSRSYLQPLSRCLSPLLACAVLNLGAVSAANAVSNTGAIASLTDSAALRAAVTVDGIIGHLTALQAIADAHGGTRTAGTGGDKASIDYVAARLREAGYAVRFETFTLPVFEQVHPPSLTVLAEVGGGDTHGDVEVRTMTFSGAGTVEAPVWPAGRGKRGAGDAAARGCEASDFKGMPPKAIALVRRGECSLDRKVGHAADAGAAAIMVYDRDRDDDGSGAAFQGELDEPAAIPAVTLTHAAGMRLAQAARRDRVMARLSVEARVDQRPTRNVLAERTSGDPERVILIGTHLDSVPDGPGINDNGSGVAAILEIARQISRLGIETPNRLRFVFWGAEENGMLGSSHHAASLSPEELQRIAAVLNFDTLGSPNYARFIYDGDGSASDEAGPPGSARIEQLFRAYFAAAGLPVTEIALEDESDHLSFVEYGLPVGGLVAGDSELKSPEEAKLFGGSADEPYDPCFHQACDTLAAINRTVLDELADAVAHAVLVLGAEPWPSRRAHDAD